MSNVSQNEQEPTTPGSEPIIGDLSNENKQVTQPQGPCARAEELCAKENEKCYFFDPRNSDAQYYLRHTASKSQNEFHLRVDGARRRVYGDKAREFLNESLFTFQFHCDKWSISTLSPTTFFTSLADYIKDPGHIENAIPIFLYAAADNGFIFDSAFVNYSPVFFHKLGIFISRAAIAELKKEMEKHPEQYAKELKELLKSNGLSESVDTWSLCLSIIDHCQVELRDLQLLLPSGVQYESFWRNVLLPLVGKQCERVRVYAGSKSLNKAMNEPLRFSKDQKQQLDIITTKCFEQYIKCDNEFLLKENIEYLAAQIGNPDSLLRGNIAKILETLEDGGYMTYGPIIIFQALTKRKKDILSQNISVDADQIVKGFSAPSNTDYKSESSSSRKHFRRNLLLFKRLCYEMNDFFPENSIERSHYLLEHITGYTAERYPSPELVPLSAEDDKDKKNKIDEYIRSGNHAGEAVFEVLEKLVCHIEDNTYVSPFDVLSHRSWKTKPEQLYAFLDSAKKSPRDDEEPNNGPGKRGKSTTKRTAITNQLQSMPDFNQFFNRYREHVFFSQFGYGSGIPTYRWALDLANLIDHALASLPDLDKLRRECGDELVELGIHAVMLDQIRQETNKQAAKLGKELLYSEPFGRISISEKDDIWVLSPDSSS